MPTGERATRPGWRRPAAPPRRGFTWLLLLFGLAIAGAGLATLGTQWQQAAQREREAELLFRGLQLRDALRRYQAQSPPNQPANQPAGQPAGQPALPRTLDELLTDRRWPEPRHHLRRLWTDPFTGAADWVLLRSADGGIVGLHSRATQPLLRRAGLPDGVADATAGQPPRAPRASDWLFVIQPPAAPTTPTPPLAAAGPATRERSP